MRLRVPSLTLLSGLRIRHCLELWCRSQTRLGSGIAVAVALAVTAAPIRPLAWESPYAMGVALVKKKKKDKKVIMANVNEDVKKVVPSCPVGSAVK